MNISACFFFWHFSTRARTRLAGLATHRHGHGLVSASVSAGRGEIAQHLSMHCVCQQSAECVCPEHGLGLVWGGCGCFQGELRIKDGVSARPNPHHGKLHWRLEGGRGWELRCGSPMCGKYHSEGDQSVLCPPAATSAVFHSPDRRLPTDSGGGMPTYRALAEHHDHMMVLRKSERRRPLNSTTAPVGRRPLKGAITSMTSAFRPSQIILQSLLMLSGGPYGVHTSNHP